MPDKIFTGRRKTSVARVIVRPGSGNISINGKDYQQFFAQPGQRDEVTMPLQVTESLGTYDVKISVKGGGLTGQAGAIKLGIARALSDVSEDFKTKLKSEGLLSRDPRMVERKKYGQPKARKKFQFSKR